MVFEGVSIQGWMYVLLQLGFLQMLDLVPRNVLDTLGCVYTLQSYLQLGYEYLCSMSIISQMHAYQNTEVEDYIPS